MRIYSGYEYSDSDGYEWLAWACPWDACFHSAIEQNPGRNLDPSAFAEPGALLKIHWPNGGATTFGDALAAAQTVGPPHAPQGLKRD